MTDLGLVACRDRFAVVNSLRLHYLERGLLTAAPVLLVHGLNVDAHSWDPIADQLAADFHVFALDLRGHGDSDWTREGYATRSFVADIAAFIDLLATAPIAFVGHSLGARIGVAFAGEHSDMLSCLVLSDGGPELPRDAALHVRARAAKNEQVRGFRTEEDALAYFRERGPEWLPVFHELQVRHQLRRNWAGRLVFKADPELMWITGSAGLAEVPYLWDMASRIEAPTLIMRGRTSPILSEEIADRMVRTIPGSCIRTFDTGHYIPRERPEEFADAVRSFVLSARRHTDDD